MKTKILRAAHFVTKQWSGGGTTQLFLHPPTADYETQNFDFRLSTATVETETSDFTLLPNYTRKLMVLAGATTLQHQNGHTMPLSKFEVATFDGGLKTTAAGRCIDFNVMTKPHLSSALYGLSLPKDEIYLPEKTIQLDYFFVYVFSGIAQVMFSASVQILKKGDLFVAHKSSQFSIKALESCDLVFVEIF